MLTAGEICPVSIVCDDPRSDDLCNGNEFIVKGEAESFGRDVILGIRVRILFLGQSTLFFSDEIEDYYLTDLRPVMSLSFHGRRCHARRYIHSRKSDEAHLKDNSSTAFQTRCYLQLLRLRKAI